MCGPTAIVITTRCFVTSSKRIGMDPPIANRIRSFHASSGLAMPSSVMRPPLIRRSDLVPASRIAYAGAAATGDRDGRTHAHVEECLRAHRRERLLRAGSAPALCRARAAGDGQWLLL